MKLSLICVNKSDTLIFINNQISKIIFLHLSHFKQYNFREDNYFNHYHQIQEVNIPLIESTMFTYRSMAIRTKPDILNSKSGCLGGVKPAHNTTEEVAFSGNLWKSNFNINDLCFTNNSQETLRPFFSLIIIIRIHCS